MDADILAQRAKDYVMSVMEDESLSVMDRLNYLNYLKTVVSVVLNTSLRFYEEEFSDGRDDGETSSTGD